MLGYFYTQKLFLYQSESENENLFISEAIFFSCTCVYSFVYARFRMIFFFLQSALSKSRIGCKKMWRKFLFIGSTNEINVGFTIPGVCVMNVMKISYTQREIDPAALFSTQGYVCRCKIAFEKYRDEEFLNDILVLKEKQQGYT